MVSFGQKWMYSGKVVLFRKVVVFGQSVCIREKVAVFRQKWMFSGMRL